MAEYSASLLPDGSGSWPAPKPLIFINSCKLNKSSSCLILKNKNKWMDLITVFSWYKNEWRELPKKHTGLQHTEHGTWCKQCIYSRSNEPTSYKATIMLK